ncbi:hypothetical protein [Cedecea sp. HN178]
MKDMSEFELAVRLSIVIPAILCAAVLAYREKEGWGWLIFVAILAMA